ncbi:MAG: FKBP-type peptidyl-prolyl cis-trans isomerase [Candidatus Obscuribacter sp.]|nr:FKBP-type peptidyl-prolyl cis-trans isomerase [Candidatus Obscuribacter sp.]
MKLKISSQLRALLLIAISGTFVSACSSSEDNSGAKAANTAADSAATTSSSVNSQTTNTPGANQMTQPTQTGAVTTPSGLQYEEIVVGNGASPKSGHTVVVHYTGWLTDGTKFDSSVDRGQPFKFQIGQGMVIKGWDEGVMTMKVGGKRKLTIPADLGYGARGAGGVIPPNATLVFEVQLLGLE